MEGIIFDMDGVLFDTERISAQITSEIALEHGFQVSPSFLQSLCSADYETVKALFQNEFGDALSLDAFSAEHEVRFAAEIERELPEKPGVREVLTAARELGLKCAIASSTRYERVVSNLKRAGIDGYFDVMFGGDRVKHSKPHPEIYESAAAALGLAPSACFAVEDSRNGVKSATGAGCKTIMVPDSIAPDAELERLTFRICESLHALIPILQAEAAN